MAKIRCDGHVLWNVLQSFTRTQIPNAVERGQKKKIQRRGETGRVDYFFGGQEAGKEGGWNMPHPLSLPAMAKWARLRFWSVCIVLGISLFIEFLCMYTHTYHSTCQVLLSQRSIPTNVSYNASAVITYRTANGLECFSEQNYTPIHSKTLKPTSARVLYLACCQMVPFQTKTPDLGKFWKILQ
jgi:hypothetical protein